MKTKNKKVKKIDGADLNLKIGKPATIRMQHQWLLTSPIERYSVSGGNIFIETRNTIYISGRA